MKVLIVSKTPTHPNVAGNCQAIMSQVRELEERRVDVHFLYVLELPLRKANRELYFDSVAQMKEYWGEKLHIFRIPLLEKIWFNALYRIREKLFHHYYGTDDTYPVRLTQYVKKLQDKELFDVCVVNYYFLTKLFEKVAFHRTAIYTHDCFSYKEKVVGFPIESLTASNEAKALQRADCIFAIQDIEAMYFSKLSPLSKIFVTYSTFEFHNQDVVGNRNLLFFSSSNQFNINGINHFMTKVFPIIREHCETRLLIGGSICDYLKNVDLPEGIELLGRFDNPADFYMKGDVVINPVYQGTGLKIKTFEALSYGKTIVAHPHSLEGIFNPSMCPAICPETDESWISVLSEIWDSPNLITKKKQDAESYLEALAVHIKSEYDNFIEYCC